MLKMFHALRPGRGTTKFVAASDASLLSKLLADYVCDGVADEAEIAAAFAALPASKGSVRLSEGTFAISTTLTLSIENSQLQGSGLGTQLVAVTNMAVTQTSIINITGNFIQVSDLGVDGNKANQSSGPCIPMLISGNDVHIDHVSVINGKTGLTLSNIGSSGDRSVITRCMASGSEGTGIQITAGLASRIIGCYASGNGGHGINSNGSQSSIQGNISTNNLTCGVAIAGTGTLNVVEGNVATLNGTDGLLLGASTTDSACIGNIALGNSQVTTLTNANIRISGTRGVVADNLCRQGSQTNKPSYGININGTDTYVRNNDLYDGGALGEINDTGVRTRRQARSQVAVAGGDTINTTAAETNFATGHAHAADAFKHIGRVIRVYASGTYGTHSAGTVTLQLKLKVGTITVLDFGTITTAINIAARRWRVEAVLTVVAVGASGSFECAGMARIPTANDDVTASLPNVGSTTTLDTTVAQTIQISAQHGASQAANTIVLREFVLEVLN